MMATSPPGSPRLAGLTGSRIRRLSLRKPASPSPTIAEIAGPSSPLMTPGRMLDMDLPSSPTAMVMALSLTDPRPLASFAPTSASGESSRPSSQIMDAASELEDQANFSRPLPPPPRRRRSYGPDSGKDGCPSPSGALQSREATRRWSAVDYPVTPLNQLEAPFAPPLPVHQEEEVGEADSIRDPKSDESLTPSKSTILLHGLGLQDETTSYPVLQDTFPNPPLTPTMPSTPPLGSSPEDDKMSRQASVSTTVSMDSSEIPCDVFTSVPASPMTSKTSAGSDGSMPCFESPSLTGSAASAMSPPRPISLTADSFRRTSLDLTRQPPQIITESLHSGASRSRICFDASAEGMLKDSPAPSGAWLTASSLPQRHSVEIVEGDLSPVSPSSSWTDRIKAIGRRSRHLRSLSLSGRPQGQEPQEKEGGSLAHAGDHSPASTSSRSSFSLLPSRMRTSEEGQSRSFYSRRSGSELDSGNGFLRPPERTTGRRSSRESVRGNQAAGTGDQIEELQLEDDSRKFSITLGRLSLGSMPRPALIERRSSSRISSIFSSKSKARTASVEDLGQRRYSWSSRSKK